MTKSRRLLLDSAIVCPALFHALRSPLGVLPHESSIRVPETQLAFHRHAQPNAFHRLGVHQQRTLSGPSRSAVATQPQLQPALFMCGALAYVYGATPRFCAL